MMNSSIQQVHIVMIYAVHSKSYRPPDRYCKDHLWYHLFVDLTLVLCHVVDRSVQKYSSGHKEHTGTRQPTSETRVCSTDKQKYAR